MKTKNLVGLALVFALFSCSSSDVSPTLGGKQSLIGKVGNTFSLGSITGAENFSAEVTSLDNGVSGIKAKIKITDSKMLEIGKTIPGLIWNGNTCEVTQKYKITDEGAQNIYDDANFTLIKYADNVGDSYTSTHNGNKITRTISYKSTNDDYKWGLYNIKVMKVEETGRKVAGVNKIEYILNHKFGLVGFKVYFEDGSSKEVRFFSMNDN